MNKVSNEQMARELAIKDCVCYGKSVFGGGWYTGTREQLGKIGVAEVVDPQCVKGDAALGLALKILVETVEELGGTHPYMAVRVSISPRGVGVGVNTHGGAGFQQLEDVYTVDVKDASFWVRVAAAVKAFAAENPSPAF